MPDNTVYVGRPSRWGNPFSKKEIGFHYSAERAVHYFEVHLSEKDRRDIKRELRGKNLACWCRLDHVCHADVLLKIANS